MTDPTSGFTLPDWRAPLDAAAHIALAPEGSVKGIFFRDLVTAAASVHGTLEKARQRYLPFIDYPMREYMDLLIACAGVVHPREPLRSALRWLGRLAYPTFADTLLGRAIFGVAGRDAGTILRLTPRGYSTTLKPSAVTVAQSSKGRVVVQLREVWTFADCYHVGVFEGALLAVDQRGEVKSRVLSPCDVDFEVTWSK